MWQRAMPASGFEGEPAPSVDYEKAWFQVRKGRG